MPARMSSATSCASSRMACRVVPDLPLHDAGVVARRRRRVVGAADGSNLAIRAIENVRWSVHREQIRAAYAVLNVVHEDSDRRFWFEIGEAPRIQHYIAVLDGATICAALLEVYATSGRDEIVRRIADGFGRTPTSGTPAQPARHR
jgi:hypothetical protein